MTYTVRPISDRTQFTGKRRPSPFDSSWPSTEPLLVKEFGAHRGRDVVLERDFTEKQWRIDGRPKANAIAASPAARLAFDSVHGPLTYATDAFPRWQDNVRAIALGLEALRKVDRYGITKRGEQYAGWKQLPSGNGAAPSHMTREKALATIARLSAEMPGHYAHDHDMRRYAAHPDEIRKDWKKARALHHPDRHAGDREVWDLVEQAAKVLGVLR